MALLVQLVDGVVGNKFALDKEMHQIGRHPASDIVIDDVAVSTRHAVIEAHPNRLLDGYCDYVLRDLGSTNGTFVNEEQVQRKQLAHGDLVRIGWNQFRFIDDNELDFEKTVRILPGATC